MGPGQKVDVSQKRTLKVMYLFAGKRRQSDVGSLLRAGEEAGHFNLVLKEIDIERGPEHDLRDKQLWESIFAELQQGDWFLIVSPPCNSFSRARFQYRKHPGPRPLRNRTWPKGFPWLSRHNKQIVDEANSFIEQCLAACRISAAAGGKFLLEHPEDLGLVEGEHPGSIWQWEELQELLVSASALTFAIHQCQFGALFPKPTRLLTNARVEDSRCHFGLPRFDKCSKYIGPLSRSCGHHHEHKLIGKTQEKWNTAPSAAYPEGLCRFIMQVILDSCSHSPGGGGVKNLKRKLEAQNPSGEQTQLVEVPVDKKPKCDAGDEKEVQLVTDDENEVQLVTDGETEEQFDMAGCMNFGKPIIVEWDGKKRPFVDGLGLCSPTRWPPSCRAFHRPTEMKEFAEETFNLLKETAVSNIGDVRREAFRLATGNMKESPFSSKALAELRHKWAKLLESPSQALIVDEGQPFLLRGLAQWLKKFGDPDYGVLVDGEDSFATGVWVGVDKPLPRCPQVFPERVKHRKLDETEFNPIAFNYPSAQLSSKELEEKFKEEEQLGRMFPTTLPVLVNKYGKEKVRVASMAAITKPDGSVRPLHDATHSVMVNHEIRYADQIQCPGPAEVAAMVREAGESGEAPFCLSADIRAAHRLFKIRESDWSYLACKCDSNSPVVWANRVGTFGVSSTPYWWSRLMGLIGRFSAYVMGTSWFMQVIYVDDLHGSFTGQHKFLHLWIWLLTYELVGVPFGYHKFHGGLSSDFVGYHLRYDLGQIGISQRRGRWLREWIARVDASKYVVQTREFAEFLGRLGFVAQLLTWMKAHLSPLFSWAAATSSGTVAKLPETVILSLKYLLKELSADTYLVSALRPAHFSADQFRTDAKCTDDTVVIAGWECSGSKRRWFSLVIKEDVAPYLFRPGKGAQWASTSAELLASLAALFAFGWLEVSARRRSLPLVLNAGTDNQSNEALSQKRATTKWPLMIINMQLSVLLSAARLQLNLVWRPRDQNTEADDLTNEKFDNFDAADRISFAYSDLPLTLLHELWETKKEFDEAKKRASSSKASGPHAPSKKFDKSPW